MSDVVRKVSDGVWKVSNDIMKIWCGGRSKKGVRWCQEGAIWFWKMSDVYRKLPDGVRKVSGGVRNI